MKKDRDHRIKKIKLFMASPSDTPEERKAFATVVNSINRSRAEKEGYNTAVINRVPTLYFTTRSNKEDIGRRCPRSPVLSDMDGIGDLKKEADTILFSDRSQRVSSGLSRYIAEIIIAKNKNGPSGLVLRKYYLPEYCSFGGDVRDDRDRESF